MTNKKPIYGVGINDSDTPVKGNDVINGVRVNHWYCPYYDRWMKILTRCYSKKFQEKNPSYKGCKVCDDWHFFSNFKKWMERQNWQGKEIDKDILVKGNKIYAPEFCCFVDSWLNKFLTDNLARRGDLPVGVDFNKRAGKFRARVSNPITRKSEQLGYFNDPKVAAMAYFARKKEIANEIASNLDDERVSNALRVIYD